MLGLFDSTTFVAKKLPFRQSIAEEVICQVKGNSDLGLCVLRVPPYLQVIGEQLSQVGRRRSRSLKILFKLIYVLRSQYKQQVLNMLRHF